MDYITQYKDTWGKWSDDKRFIWFYFARKHICKRVSRPPYADEWRIIHPTITGREVVELHLKRLS